MRILIPTLIYGRHKTFDVFAQGIRDLQTAYPEHEIDCLAVGTGDKEAVGKHGFKYYEYPNILSKKAQYRLELCENKADYYLFLGSDDIINVQTFGYYLKQIEDGAEWIAPYDIFYWINREIFYSEGYTSESTRYGESLAVGRCLSNNVLTQVNWSLWETLKERNIDRQAYERLKALNVMSHFFCLRHIGGFICDIKTKDNLSKWNNKWRMTGLQSQFFSKKMVKLLNKL